MRIVIPEDFTQKQFEDKINEVGIENITILIISDNSYITKIPCFPNLKELCCYCDTNIISISSMKNLEILCCYECPNIAKFPSFPNLKKLILLHINTNIYSISPMENLEKLHLINCPKLVKIPYLPNLKYLNCFNDYLKIKFYKKDLNFEGDKKNISQHLQGRLYQNTYRTYELLIF